QRRQGVRVLRQQREQGDHVQRLPVARSVDKHSRKQIFQSQPPASRPAIHEGENMRTAAKLIRSVFVSLVLIICVAASARVGNAPRADSAPPRADSAPSSEDSTKGIEVKRDKDGFLEGRDYKMGGCWVILFVRVLPPAETGYFNYLADGWKKQQEALNTAGIIGRYTIMYTNRAHKNDYNFML